MDLTSFLEDNNLAHLVQHMLYEGVTLDILLQANDAELSLLTRKIIDKIKLRLALDKLRNTQQKVEQINQSVKVSFPVRETLPLSEVLPTSKVEETPTSNIQSASTSTATTISLSDGCLLPTHDEITSFPDEEWSLSLNSADIDVLGKFSIKRLGLETGRNLRLLLSSVSIGKVLLAKSENEENLNSQDRALLVKLIVEAELHALDPHNQIIRKDIWQQWAKEVVQLFKGETAAIYYLPYHVIDGRVIQASGLFHNRLITHRRYLNSFKNKRKYSTNNKENNSPSLNRSFEDSIKRIRPLPKTFSTGESSENSSINDLNWLKSSSFPQSMVIQKWKSTFQLRNKLLSTSSSYKEIFSIFPALKLANGFKLMLIDFDAVYPTATKTFNENFPIIKTKLLTLLAEKADSVKPDQSILDLLNLASESEEHANLAAFLSIIFLLRQMHTISVPRKKLWKLSREEVRTAFIAKVSSASDIERFCTDREAFVAAKGIPEQPYVIAVGATWSTISYYEIVIYRGVRYQVSNICNAIMTIYAVYWALDCAYPKDSVPCWMFVQRTMFAMKSKFDTEGLPLRELIAKIKA